MNEEIINLFQNLFVIGKGKPNNLALINFYWTFHAEKTLDTLENIVYILTRR